MFADLILSFLWLPRSWRRPRLWDRGPFHHGRRGQQLRLQRFLPRARALDRLLCPDEPVWGHPAGADRAAAHPTPLPAPLHRQRRGQRRVLPRAPPLEVRGWIPKTDSKTGPRTKSSAKGKKPMPPQSLLRSLKTLLKFPPNPLHRDFYSFIF